MFENIHIKINTNKNTRKKKGGELVKRWKK